MEGRNVGIIIAVLVVLAGAWYFLSGGTAKAPSGMDQTVPTGSSEPGNAAASSAPAAVTTGATVAYTDQGFSPAHLTVKQGTTVTFVNQSSDSMWVASGVHPTHQSYDGTTRTEHCAAGYTGPAPFDECAAEASFSFTFTKVGTWQYHNHLEPSVMGSVTVTAQ